MNELIPKPRAESLESMSEDFKVLMNIVASSPIAYIRKLFLFEDTSMLFHEITPVEVVVSTDLPSIYFLSGRERLPLWGENIRTLTYPQTQLGDLRCIAIVTASKAFQYELYEDIGADVAGPAVYVQPLAGIEEQSWLDKTDKSVVRLR